MKAWWKLQVPALRPAYVPWRSRMRPRSARFGRGRGMPTATDLLRRVRRHADRGPTWVADEHLVDVHIGHLQRPSPKGQGRSHVDGGDSCAGGVCCGAADFLAGGRAVLGGDGLGGHLSSRVPSPNLGGEFDKLADTLNELAQRLDAVEITRARRSTRCRDLRGECRPRS